MNEPLKPVLVGFSGPSALSPDHALYPYPPGSPGAILFELLTRAESLTREEYLDTFERHTLLTGLDSDTRRAATRAGELRQGWRMRTVVLLGTRVREAFRLPMLLIHPMVVDGIVFRQLPQPVSHGPFYSDERNQHIVGQLLAELYRTYNGALA